MVKQFALAIGIWTYYPYVFLVSRWILKSADFYGSSGLKVKDKLVILWQRGKALLLLFWIFQFNSVLFSLYVLFDKQNYQTNPWYLSYADTWLGTVNSAVLRSQEFGVAAAILVVLLLILLPFIIFFVSSANKMLNATPAQLPINKYNAIFASVRQASFTLTNRERPYMSL